jgi:hypothetical protein
MLRDVSMVVLRFVMLVVLAASVAGQGWLDVSNPANTPGGRNGHAMVYDEARGYCLMTQGDTWTYDGTTWTQRFPSTLPVAPVAPNGISTFQSASTLSHRSVFQSHNQRPLIAIQHYNLRSSSAACFERGISFFEWDGADWYSISSIWPMGPHVCYSGLTAVTYELMYDRVRGEAVVLAVAPSLPPTTWTLTNGAWQIRASLVVPPIAYGGLARGYFDESRQRCVLVLSSPPSMWEWNGLSGNWSQCFPQYLGYPILQSTFGPVAYDPNSAVGIGLGVDQPYTTRTLAYGTCDIELMALGAMPAVRTNYAIAFDRQRGKFVMQGGSGYADTWELDLGPSASYSLFSAGCLGSRGVPTLATNGFVPVGGQTMFVQVNNLPFTAPTFMFLGFSDTTYAGLALPFDLNVLGAPGCNLRVSGDQLSGVTNVLGVGLWQFPVPNLPGAVFYNQAIVFDPQANMLGLTFSNGGRGVIGN